VSVAVAQSNFSEAFVDLAVALYDLVALAFDYQVYCYPQQHYSDMRTHKSLKPGKFCLADLRHNIGCCQVSGFDRIEQIVLNSLSHSRRLIADRLLDTLGDRHG
jgi:hypothetical protein